MTDQQQLAVREATQIAQQGFDDPTRELIHKAVSDPRQPLSTDEFELFLAVCRHTGLNPLLKEIYALRIDGRFTVLPGVDGYRRIAQASPRFRGMAGPLWCSADGQWADAWLGEGPPAACKVGVYLPGQREPTWAVAYYKNYRSRRSPTWQTMPEHMLAIRAEVHALRKCFSRELGAIAMPDDDDAGWGEVGDGALDTPSPRGRAIAAQMDAALAEADALLAEPPSSAEALRRSLDYARREGKYAEAASLEEEVAEAEAREQEQAPEETGELPGPRWGTTALGRQVSALADALLALPESDPARRFVLPANAATDAEIEQWIASKRRLLAAKRAQR